MCALHDAKADDEQVLAALEAVPSADAVDNARAVVTAVAACGTLGTDSVHERVTRVPRPLLAVSQDAVQLPEKDDEDETPV